MGKNLRTWGLVAASIVATVSAVTPAAAVTLLNAPASSGQITAFGPANAVNFNFAGGAGLAALNFNIEGYTSLDGAGNCCTDTFEAYLNGALFFSGAFDLGGGGANVLNLAPAGTTFNVTPASTGNPTFGGGLAAISTTLNLIEGINTLSFFYVGPLQGAGDEGWGLNGVLVEGNAVGAVPEPAAWAMMIVGFGIAGGALRYRKRSTKISFATA